MMLFGGLSPFTFFVLREQQHENVNQVGHIIGPGQQNC